MDERQQEVKLEIVKLRKRETTVPLNLATIQLETDKENPTVYWIIESKLFKGKLVKIPDINEFIRKLPREHDGGQLRQFNSEKIAIVIEFLNARDVEKENYLIKNPEGFWGYTKDVVDITEDALQLFAYSRVKDIQKKKKS